MTTTPTPGRSPEDERQALADAERAASEQQPGSYKEQATDEKVVEIPPIGGSDDKPIRGLDPK